MAYERMLKALVGIKCGSVSKQLSDCLCGINNNVSLTSGCSLPNTYTIPSVARLDDAQKRAIQMSLEKAVCLIQGPPGTGKTTTSICIIYHLYQLTRGKILALAPSNTAVDNLCVRVAKTGLNVVRLSALSRQNLSSALRELEVHIKALNICPELARLQRKKDRDGSLTEPEKKLYRRLKLNTEGKAL
ncbi:unnamed protein product [Echinostoma caproni]|uniref:AAA_11 domain-containing protein n=1 Tax=Echinostoma caproni TaxID=27848 RepID=A0A183A1Z6_9TREM|nr:unnamed protein product [Echinostoma caproni]